MLAEELEVLLAQIPLDVDPGAERSGAELRVDRDDSAAGPPVDALTQRLPDQHFAID